MADEGLGQGASDFGALLRRYRIEAGLSQEALAERARLSLNSISALERGYRRSPRRETLALLVGALALRPEQRKTFEAAAARPCLPRRRRTREITVGPWAAPSTSALPLALTKFIGRAGELDEIRALMREHRLVTVTGAAGIGKTQSALRAVTGPDADCPVCFIDLAPIADSSLVVTAVATALAVQAVPYRPLLETLTAYLKYKNELLIFDNCEHLVAEVAPLSETLLLNCPNVQILAT
ncbi:MAG TPA: helix-turn-helix domain-containing protein, partial [Candidatus Cybelea sp.]|nr:helix-turn-helix domain-containing protein [Candidatus Cybelea sp.]